jgi:large repetitive protein
LPDGIVDTGYSQAIISLGGTLPITFSITAGTLPPGLGLSSTGVLSGEPAAVGSYSFTLTATDSNSFAANQAYTINIKPFITFVSSTLAAWTVNRPGYSQPIMVSGGIGTLTFSSSGAVPAGLALSSSGILEGIPAAAGSYTFTVTDFRQSGTNLEAKNCKRPVFLGGWFHAGLKM